MSQRIIKINVLLKRIISKILRNNYQDESCLITIVKVETFSDISCAKVYYAVLGDKNKEHIAKKFLNSISKKIRKQISKYISLRTIPSVNFVLDCSIKNSLLLIKKIEKLDKKDI